MTTFLLLVSLVASCASTAAGVVFIVKKVRKRWIPNAVFAVWAGGAGAALLVHVFLDKPDRAVMNVVVMVCAAGSWVAHQVSRRYV